MIAILTCSILLPFVDESTTSSSPEERLSRSILKAKEQYVDDKITQIKSCTHITIYTLAFRDPSNAKPIEIEPERDYFEATGGKLFPIVGQVEINIRSTPSFMDDLCNQIRERKNKGIQRMAHVPTHAIVAVKKASDASRPAEYFQCTLSVRTENLVFPFVGANDTELIALSKQFVTSVSTVLRYPPSEERKLLAWEKE